MIKFVDLEAQYASIKDEISDAVQKVLASGSYVLGPEVEAFEHEFASAHGAAEGVALNSGTSALHLALLAAGVGAGDEVITVAMTFTATAAAICYTGATPVFVDVDPMSYTMNAAAIESKISRKTKAILPVHLYGQAADMDAIMAIARRHSVTVIEDAAQAHLALYKGRPVGSIGHIGAFSFYPGKNLGAYGEGGIAITNDPAFAERMRILRDWGQVKKYQHEVLAYNYRMDSLQGAILRVKLRHLNKWTESRRSNAAAYRSALDGIAVQSAAELPDRRHVYHIFSIFHPERDRLRQGLGDRGIQTGVHYPIPVHVQKAYANLGYAPGDLPVTEWIAAKQLSLPMYAELGVDAVEEVARAVEALT